MLIDIHIKFCEDILNCFQVIEWTCFFMTGNVPREIVKKNINARVMVLALMLIDIYIKCLEDTLNRLQIKEWTQFCNGQSSKGNSSKGINARVMVLALCCCLMLFNTYMKFCEDSLNSFQVIWRTQFCV